jgi:hypothetical protein
MIRKFFVSVCLGFALICALCAGCGKSEPRPVAENSSFASSTTNSHPSTSPILRLHWLGKKQIATDHEATNFIAIWNLPESLKLEAQTLDKLATSPWRLLGPEQSLSNAPVPLLRPLLEDLIQEEVRFELHAISNADQSAKAFTLAIRLPSDRAELWQTNLPTVLESLVAGEITRTPTNFLVRNPRAEIGLSQSENGIIVSALFFSGANASSDPTEVATLRKRMGNFRQAIGTNWLDMEMATSQFLPWFAPGLVDKAHALKTNLPNLLIQVCGESGNIRTLATCFFPAPFPVEIEAWNIPTNLVHDPLCGFMAIRGLRPTLKLLGWREANWGPVPNQFYSWAQAGAAPLHFFAIPSVTANNQVNLWGDFLLNTVNPLMAGGANLQNTPIGAFERVTNSARIRWRGLPLLAPELDWSPNDGNPFISGGLFSNRITNRPAPALLLQQLANDSSLVLYDWEQSQPGAYRLIQSGQLTRLVFGRARLSMTNNPSLPWVVAISQKLGTAGTSLRLTQPQQLVLSRSSTVGLTAWELHLLVEWLESPEFPKGLFSLLTPKPISGATIGLPLPR